MGSMAVDTPPPRRAYLLTLPRTASNLLVKMLNLPGQDQVAANEHLGGYFYMKPFIERNELEMWDVNSAEIPEDKRAKIEASLQTSTDNMVALVEKAEKDNKVVFIKEHVSFITKAHVFEEIRTGKAADTNPAPWSVHIDPATDVHSSANPTLLPDNFLTTFTPVFLIRHPALAFPSALRANAGSDINFDEKPRSSSDAALTDQLASYLGMRRLYDFYVAQHTSNPSRHAAPTIIEASDLINHPHTVTYHFCDVTGLDKTKLKFAWDSATKEELEKQSSDFNRRFLSTISASTGVMKAKAATATIDIDAEAAKWRAEFGQTVSDDLVRCVRREMSNYEYLLNQRWCPPADSA